MVSLFSSEKGTDSSELREMIRDRERFCYSQSWEETEDLLRVGGREQTGKEGTTAIQQVGGMI